MLFEDVLPEHHKQECLALKTTTNLSSQLSSTLSCQSLDSTLTLLAPMLTLLLFFNSLSSFCFRALYQWDKLLIKTATALCFLAWFSWDTQQKNITSSRLSNNYSLIICSQVWIILLICNKKYIFNRMIVYPDITLLTVVLLDAGNLVASGRVMS